MGAIRIAEHVAAHQVGGRTLHVDIFQPTTLTDPAPGLLFLPGGGWRTADRAPLKERFGIRMAERGYVCVTGEYRVMDEAPWPAPIQDVKALLRWMRANHERLGIDPTAIAVGGKSAGGHLALLAAGSQGVTAFDGPGEHAAVSSDVAAVIGVAAVSDMSEWAYLPRLEPLFGPNPTTAVVQAASPLTYANSAYPPTLLIHGTADETVPCALSKRMAENLEQAGVPVDLQLYAGQDHFFDRNPLCSEAVANAMAFFLARYVQVQAAAAAG